jgi:septin family protein
VIAKADLLTKNELQRLKRHVLDAMEFHNIKFFTFPVESDDEETTTANRGIMSSVPFAIVASETDIITRDGHKVRGRQYPWGYVEGT